VSVLAVDPREEERRAREQYRNLERARRAQQTQYERETARKIREAAAEARSRHKSCRCDFRGVRTKAQLKAMAGCTEAYICPRLDYVRRQVI
jgi:predicted ABC-class ATPase